MYSNLCPVESVLCIQEKCHVCETDQLKSVFPSPIHGLLQFLNLKVSKNIFCLPAATLCGKIRARTQRTNYIWNTDPSNLALNTAHIFNYAGTIHFHKEIVESQLSFFSLFYPFSSTLLSFAGFCVWTNEYKRLDNISKNSTGTSYIHEIQNTTEISHSLVHYTRLFNHDKLLYLQIHKNYSIIHIILNQNKSCQHKCQLKVTNLVKFWPIKNVFGSIPKNILIFSRKVLMVALLLWRHGTSIRKSY